MLGEVAKTADAYANLSARIKLVTGDGDAFKTSLQGVVDVAQATGTSLETVGDLFGKIATAGKQIGVSNAQALALTESIAQATQLRVYAAISGRSENSIRMKIRDGKWIASREFFKDPDGTVLIDREAVQRWILRGR